jgi:hypothetical protein
MELGTIPEHSAALRGLARASSVALPRRSAPESLEPRRATPTDPILWRLANPGLFCLSATPIPAVENASWSVHLSQGGSHRQVRPFDPLDTLHLLWGGPSHEASSSPRPFRLFSRTRFLSVISATVLASQLFDFVTGGFPDRMSRQLFLPRLEKVLAPSVVEVGGDAFSPTQIRDAPGRGAALLRSVSSQLQRKCTDRRGDTRIDSVRGRTAQRLVAGSPCGWIRRAGRRADRRGRWLR